MKKRRLLIGVFSICAVLVISILTTVIVLASGTHDLKSSLKIRYVATQIKGSGSATYKIGTGSVTKMTTDGTASGGTKVSFDVTDPSEIHPLKPQAGITLTTTDTYVVFSYTFTNEGETYYATLKNGLSGTTGLSFTYATDSGFSSMVPSFSHQPIKQGSTTLYIKISLSSQVNDISCSGSFTWNLNYSATA